MMGGFGPSRVQISGRNRTLRQSPISCAAGGSAEQDEGIRTVPEPGVGLSGLDEEVEELSGLGSGCTLPVLENASSVSLVSV